MAAERAEPGAQATARPEAGTAPTLATRVASHLPDPELVPTATRPPSPVPQRPGIETVRRSSAQLPDGRAQLHSFRMESLGAGTPSRQPEAAGRAGASAAAPEPAQTPPDVIISSGRRDALAVTIAAASTDLRDRFLSAAGDLRQDLALLGTEVDSIRVALRAELPTAGEGHEHSEQSGQSGQSGTGDGSGSPASADSDQLFGGQLFSGQISRGQDDVWQDSTGRGIPEALDPAASGLPGEQLGIGTTAESATDPAPPEAADTEGSFADLSSGGRQPGNSSAGANPNERFRFTLSAGAAALLLPAQAGQTAAPDAYNSHRIDRYA